MDLSSQNIFPKEPVIITSEQKKQKKLLLILAGSVVATAAVLYFGVFSGGQETALTSPAPLAMDEENGASLDTPAQEETGSEATASPQSSSVSVENISLDFSVLDDPKFLSLKSFGIDLDISGPKGRSNPFVSY
jgi:hypothetical protein